MVLSKHNEAVSNNGCGNNKNVEDIKWLSSLSEHELDFLISLKELATIRAKNIGHKNLSRRFDVKLLRALGYVLLEYFKERVRNNSEIPESQKLLESLSGCGLANLNGDGDPNILNSASKSTTEDSFVCPRRKRMWAEVQESTASNHRKKRNNKV